MPGRGAAGAAAEDKMKPHIIVKSSSTNSSKKMVQARLPFKRLNPVPKDGILTENLKMSHKVPHVNTICPLDTSLEDMENGSETAEFVPLPKAVNGIGPLDNYIRKTKKTYLVTPSITIDLTEDSNGGVSDQIPCNGIVQSLPTAGSLSVCSTLNSVTSTENITACDDSSCVNSTEHSCTVSESQITDVQRLSPHSEVPSEMEHEKTTLLTSPVKAVTEDKDMSAEESPTRFSSTSSPVSVSSPEVPPSNCRDANNSESPTLLNKSKEQQEKKHISEAVKERVRIKEEEKLAKEEVRKKKKEERELKAKERKVKKEKENKEKAEKLRLKEEKKKEKLEAMEAKQEEKRKKEEEKRIKVEEKRIKAEKAEITRFLQKPKTSQTPKIFAQPCGKFAPFEIKKSMAVAPLCRVEFEQESSEHLDKLLEEQNCEALFLSEIKARKPRRMGQTMLPQMPDLTCDTEEVQMLENTDEDLHENMIVEKQNLLDCRKLGKMKLLQFSENYRPAYWGTWNSSSAIINPRKPWAQDTKLLDYEVDSDEEWEEEEPGESLSHSEGDDEDDDTKEDDDEDDDGFFVPHGYLSEDEGGVSDEECKNPENQKVQQRLKAKEWDELQSKGKKINVLKPIVIGCVWFSSCSAEIKFLQKFAACVIDPAGGEENMLQEVYSSKCFQDREILIHLLPLLHGNVHGSKAIIKEFQECFQRGMFSFSDSRNPSACETVSPKSRNQTNINIPSKARLKRIISENSVYEKRPDHRLCWYVHSDVLKSFQQEDLPVPCQWTYVTQVNLFSKDESGNGGGSIQTISTSSKRKAAGSMPITKFMKKAKTLEAVSDITLESDGFQADTEEDEDDDDDEDGSIVDEIEKENMARSPCSMEVSLNEEAAHAT
ncbi:chromatin assembly factor 1 subunit A isoform X2 [Hyla sarda]|uniref:chromatin assembly factor 1 subunit A isoform X2 n=1 Tax=Hyla sarda TaxID=327740 RepID=UPI0024C3214F|nr:chromatin assembly factor 1 subunit A isoform X2 [Hyla sarda]